MKSGSRIFQLKFHGRRWSPAGILVPILLTILVSPLSIRADDAGLYKLPEARARYALPPGPSLSEQVITAPLNLGGGSSLTLVSPQRFAPLAERLGQEMRDLHSTFNALFGEIPSFSTSVRLLSEESFFAETGAPRWTNAMYFRGQIAIPVPEADSPDTQAIARSLRHEYSHALVHALSAGRCPGWIDEGLAQWAEGDENPALQPALKRWLSKQAPVSFTLLQGGFTKLQTEMVPAAYAQSLFALNTIIRTWGFGSLKAYFENLRNGEDHPTAFRSAFAQSERTYERSISQALRNWAARRG